MTTTTTNSNADGGLVVVELAHQLAFDFEALGTALRNEGLTESSVTRLQSHAGNIRRLQEQAIRDIGRELVEAREVCEHGGWGIFLKSIGMGETTARNYMNVARLLTDAPADISATVADLPPSAQYVLASPKADPAKVGEVIAEVKAGAPVPSVPELRQRVEPQQPQQPQQRSGPLIIEDPDYEEEEEASDEQELVQPVKAKPAPAPLPAPLPIAPAAASAPAPLPPALSLAGGFDQQTRKMAALKLELLRAALEQAEADAPESLPSLVINAEQVSAAARSLLSSPALAGAAALLALSATEA